MNDHRREGSHYYEEYGEYAKTLRIWLVAYGIGVPALIISQEHVFERVLDSGQSTTIAFVFLAGVVLQILSAIIYKAAAWSFHYRTELSQPPREPATWARWLLDHYWPDVVVDLVTIAAFACPTIAVVRILADR